MKDDILGFFSNTKKHYLVIHGKMVNLFLTVFYMPRIYFTQVHGQKHIFWYDQYLSKILCFLVTHTVTN
jgi:hypothetical protein